MITKEELRNCTDILTREIAEINIRNNFTMYDKRSEEDNKISKSLWVAIHALIEAYDSFYNVPPCEVCGTIKTQNGNVDRLNGRCGNSDCPIGVKFFGG